MSLEDAINNLANAASQLAGVMNVALTAALNANAGRATPPPNAPPAQPAAPAPVAAAPAAAAPAGRARGARGAAAAPAAPAPAAAPAAAAGAAVSYDAVREKVIELAEKKGHNAALALLGNFGVKNARELKAEQYAAALTALNAELAGALA
jgi:pyruvate dehydrogenase E2 component (dihydrolipoamide acetyltransferase)